MNNQSYHTDRMNEYPDTLLTTAELGEADVPVTPLPNPGEGGPVDSGGNQNNGANVPVIPIQVKAALWTAATVPAFRLSSGLFSPATAVLSP